MMLLFIMLLRPITYFGIFWFIGSESLVEFWKIERALWLIGSESLDDFSFLFLVVIKVKVHATSSICPELSESSQSTILLSIRR